MANPTVFVSALTFTLTQRLVAGTTYTSITAATIDDWSSVTEGGFCKLNKGSAAEWFSFTGITIGATSGGVTAITFTGVTMGIDKDALTTTSTNSANRRNHASGTTVGKLVYHSQQLNKAFQIDKDNTVSGTNTFTGTNTFSSTTKATLNLQRVTTAQRDALTGVAEGSMVKNDTTGQVNVYLGGSWVALDIGSSTVNASETVAGIVEIATSSEVSNGTSTGGTGALLVATPDVIKSVYKKNGTAGETLVEGDWIYKKQSDNKLYKADNTTLEKALVIGRIDTGGSANATVYYSGIGDTFTTTGLTAGSTYYLSGTAGAATTTKPVMNSASIIPVVLFEAGSTTQATINIRRLQRIKKVVLRAGDITTDPQSVTIGFPMALVTAESYYRNNTSAPWSYQASSGYYDVLAGYQTCAPDAGSQGVHIMSIQTAAGTYWTAIASISSNNISLDVSSTTYPLFNLVLTAYEAL